MTTETTKILELLAEGGSLTLYGDRDGEQWTYTLVTDESALEDDGGGVSNRSASTWDDAVALLDRYPWRQLHVAHVDPAFTERVERARSGAGERNVVVHP